jgi:hypothetical protein
MTTPSRPRWKHDCTNCKFLGRFGKEDRYTCGRDLIIRLGPDDADYYVKEGKAP